MVSRAVLWLLLVLATLHARAALADPRRVIVFVWDGMRPDAVSQEDTPNLVALARRGTWFNDHHSSYPPITMINAMAFATGARPGPAGFYGNRLWPPRELDPRLTPGVSNTNGDSVRFRNVVFVEDDHVLRGLDAGSKGTLIEVPLLFAVAKRA